MARQQHAFRGVLLPTAFIFCFIALPAWFYTPCAKVSEAHIPAGTTNMCYDEFKSRVLPLILTRGIRRVWIDIGVNSYSDLLSDLRYFEARNETNDVLVIGFEPLKHVYEAFTGHHSKFVLLNMAISNVEGELTFYQHEDSACSTLLNTSEAKPAVHGPGDKCVQGTVTEVPVKVCMLQSLLMLLPTSVRVQVLKIDTQGNDLKVLKGVPQFTKIDYVLVETQDLNASDAKLAMYANTPVVRDFDQHFSRLGFLREYCEFNTPAVREVNCVYRRADLPPICITGRPQPDGKSHLLFQAPPCPFDGHTVVNEYHSV